MRQSVSLLAKSQIAKMHITTLKTMQTEMMANEIVRTIVGEKNPLDFLLAFFGSGSMTGGILLINLKDA